MGALDHPPHTAEEKLRIFAMTAEERRAFAIARCGAVTRVYVCKDRSMRNGKVRWVRVNAHVDGCRVLDS